MTGSERIQLGIAVEHVAATVLQFQIDRVSPNDTRRAEKLSGYTAVAMTAALGRLADAAELAEEIPDLWVAKVMRWWAEYKRTGLY